MKNINGLTEAMRIVESACEKGEITIIGEGGRPSPVELLDKCIKFINEQYGVDVLSLLMETALRKECGDCCCDYCYEEDEDEDEEEDTIVFDVEGIERYLNEAIPIAMPYLLAEYVDTVCYEIVSYCSNHNADDTVQDLNGITVKKDIADILYENLDTITRKECDRVGEILGENINNHYVLF